MLNIRIDTCPIVSPSSAATDVITVEFELEDKDANTGTVVLTGQLQAINAIDNVNSLTITGTSGSSTITTGAGNVSVTQTFGAGYDVDFNRTVTCKITDADGFDNVEDAEGATDALIAEINDHVATDKTLGSETYLKAF